MRPLPVAYTTIYVVCYLLAVNYRTADIPGQSRLNRIYLAPSPGVLLLLGWLAIAGAMGIRILNGLDIPYLNGLFVFIGLAAYFLPTRFAEREKGELLRRKLLWLCVLAGVLILIGETIRLVW